MTSPILSEPLFGSNSYYYHVITSLTSCFRPSELYLNVMVKHWPGAHEDFEPVSASGHWPLARNSSHARTAAKIRSDATLAPAFDSLIMQFGPRVPTLLYLSDLAGMEAFSPCNTYEDDSTIGIHIKGFVK